MDARDDAPTDVGGLAGAFGFAAFYAELVVFDVFHCHPAAAVGDAVVLVDNAEQPMQAAPQALLRTLAASGHERKLIGCFTHFDSVIRIRLAVARRIFSFGGLSRYSWEAAPTIHIIVKAGHVTLAGVVDTEADKNAAGIQANGVNGIFSVQNDLQVVKR